VEIICFPFERVVEINIFILEGEPDMKGTVDVTNTLTGHPPQLDCF
jgi:hypothetical protein